MGSLSEDAHTRAISIRCAGAFYLIALAVFLLDRISKYAIEAFMDPGQEIPVLGPVMSLHLRFNTGAAWGMLAGERIWLTVVAGLMLLGLLISGAWAVRMAFLIRIGLPLLAGGAAGNFIDRLLSGAVVDFIDFHVWPVFNVADIAIVCGAVLICYHLIAAEVRSRSGEEAP